MSKRKEGLSKREQEKQAKVVWVGLSGARRMALLQGCGCRPSDVLTEKELLGKGATPLLHPPAWDARMPPFLETLTYRTLRLRCASISVSDILRCATSKKETSDAST